jgi:hypothetical protein
MMRQKFIMSFPRAACRAALAAVLVAIMPAAPAFAFDAVALDGRTFVNKGLVAVGRIPAHLRDKLGETFGSGSGLAIDPQAWMREADGYRGVLYMLPDRGYNVTGTADYRARLNVLRIVLRPAENPAASPGQIGLPVEARQHSLEATLADTIVLTDAAGRPLTGLDPSPDPGPDGVRRAAGGLPDLPQAQTGAISIDSEAVVRMSDGTFFIADEYGPYIYRFSAAGRMLSAIRPPEAFIPKRSGRASCSRSTKTASCCSAATGATAMGPKAQLPSIAGSSFSTPRRQAISRARRMTAPLQSRPTASSRKGSSRRR